MKDSIFTILIVATIAVVIQLWYHTWTLGSSEDDFETICLGGHEYYRANFAMKGMVAIVLNADGKPVPCER